MIHAEVYTSGGIDFAKEQILFASIPNMRFEKLEGWGKGLSKQILYQRVFPWQEWVSHQ